MTDMAESLSYDLASLNPRDRYKLLISLVIPRPIALVTTIGPTGIVNAAPFCGMSGRSLPLPPIAIVNAAACCGILGSQLTRPATCLSVCGAPPPVSGARETPAPRKKVAPTLCGAAH